MPLHLARCFFAATAALIAVIQSAQAGPALLYDADSRRVLYAEDIDYPWYPASLTKMMTAYVVFNAWKTGRASPDGKVVISAKANSRPPMRMGLGVGKEITYEEAVHALILKSANDIAYALAEAVSGSEEAFVAEMNETAHRLGMYSTRYINPNGLPGEGQYTTAKDLAILTQALERDFPSRMGVFALHTAMVGKTQIATHNPVLTMEGGDGMKTGFTCSAGYNIVGSATRGGRRVVVIVLGEATKVKRIQRTTALLEYGFRAFEWKALLPAPKFDEVPPAFYDRVSVRAENLDKRLAACRDPEPVTAQTGDPAGPPKAGNAPPGTTGSIAIAEAAAAQTLAETARDLGGAKKSKPKAVNKVAPSKPKTSKRVAKRRDDSPSDRGPVFQLALP